MSQELINRNSDLKRLRDEGYEVEVRATYLLLHSVPYVNSRREICRGTLISTLQLAGDRTVNPSDHVALFTGEHPCNKDGSEISQIKHAFSNKPPNGYSTYYDKMTRYAQIISAPAESLDPGVSAKTHKVVESYGEESVFHYLDTASSRAGIKAIADKLVGPKLGIVGLGGQGSYILQP